jgi:HSP20 family molecular chaperone IbpA
MNNYIKSIFLLPLLCICYNNVYSFQGIQETDDAVVVTIQVPYNIDPNQITIDIQDRMLSVSGKMKAEREVSQEGYYQKVVGSSSFNRSLLLPCLVDNFSTSAELVGDRLIISMPKLKDNFAGIKVTRRE